MPIRVFMIDDEQDANELLSIHLQAFDDIKVCGSFTNSSQLLDALSHEEVDAIFMDIEIDDAHGLELTRSVQALAPDVKIVFVTAHEEYALSAFDLNVLDYLTKPLIHQRLDKTIQKLRSVIPQRHSYTPLIRLFSTMEYDDSDGTLHQLKFKTRKASELIALLLLSTRQTIHKNTMYDTLWPDNRSDSIRYLLNSNVYNANSKLKELNPPLQIVRDGDMYRFLEPVPTDTQRLDAAYQQAITSENTKAIEQSLTLYRGHLLEAEDYPWLVSYRQRYFNIYKSLVCRLSHFYFRDNYEKAIQLLLDSLGAYALSVSLNKALLKAYAMAHETALYNEHLALAKKLFSKSHVHINWDHEAKKILYDITHHEK